MAQQDRSSRRGSTLIEFALTLPLLVFLLAAVIDWGSYMSMRVSVARATMDGARAGAAYIEDPTLPGNTGDQLVVAAVDRAKQVLDATPLGCAAGVCDVVAEYCNVGEAANNCGSPPIPVVVVSTTFDYVPFFGFASIPTIISERFAMAVEQ